MLSTRNTLTAKQKVERANVSLMNNVHTRPYSGVLMVGTYRIDPDVPTAYTDGINVVYGEKFVDSLSEPQLRAVILHETLHKVLQHTFLWVDLAKKNLIVANMAMDFVVNLIIKDIQQSIGNEFIQFWDTPEPLLNEKYRGWSSDAVFRDLIKGASNIFVEGESGLNGSPMDTHGWEQAQSLPEDKREQLMTEIDMAIRQGQLLGRRTSGNTSLLLDELTKPKEDWREMMTEFMINTAPDGELSSWRKPHRRWIQYDMYMPTSITESVGNIVIGIDTSGSIDREILTKFLSHVRSICMSTQPARVDLLYWDTSIASHEVYLREDIDKLVHSTKPMGGGGTSPECVPDYLEENKITPDCCIMLTDGHVSGWGTWKYPVLWGIVDNDRVSPSVGKVMRIS